MTLREKRVEFTRCLAKLILFAVDMGLEVAIGQDGLKHMAGSLHYVGLAEDLNLYRAGTYLTATEDHRPLGAYWKELHPLARWGGDFKDGKDGNHYSFLHEGRC